LRSLGCSGPRDNSTIEAIPAVQAAQAFHADPSTQAIQATEAISYFSDPLEYVSDN
jgi:hypothetical protein